MQFALIDNRIMCVRACAANSFIWDFPLRCECTSKGTDWRRHWLDRSESRLANSSNHPNRIQIGLQFKCNGNSRNTILRKSAPFERRGVESGGWREKRWYRCQITWYAYANMIYVILLHVHTPFPCNHCICNYGRAQTASILHIIYRTYNWIWMKYTYCCVS